jgi:hypothetical protein
MDQSIFNFTSENILFLTRLGINFLTVFILIRGLYYKNYKKSDHFLSFFSFNIIIFILTSSLNKVEMSMGSAFGLFAVFSILRYRTEGLSSRDVTYLFLSIAVGLITAISSKNWIETLAINVLIITVIWLIESKWLVKREFSKTIIYDNPKLIGASPNQLVLDDLKSKISLPIHRVETVEIDLIRDSAILHVYYYE